MIKANMSASAKTWRASVASAKACVSAVVANASTGNLAQCCKSAGPNCKVRPEGSDAVELDRVADYKNEARNVRYKYHQPQVKFNGVIGTLICKRLVTQHGRNGRSKQETICHFRRGDGVSLENVFRRHNCALPVAPASVYI